ncbi:ABC transporter ATP-binding protein [Tropheryma whipplei]|uniref:ABC transporter ATP-binding protein n=1 Tax=Tropheryma whipplei (strain Twist) TaxID=203267 RepID=Q83FW1_TROWT|nr:ATP-binding cassette domain-containing protein [Tropheryma whipplei]AAO44681.1 ABC transporter ATP-binding protein [Tropheryma whipplei str. Twist]MCO8190602.1 ATP-binding cassette domain-containing protein [Tropheryma whipplei]
MEPGCASELLFGSSVCEWQGSEVAKLLDYIAESRVKKGELLFAVDGLSKFYGKDAAIEGVSFEVRAGDCVGLIGPNGGGKTTLINLILGFMPPSSGAIAFHSVLSTPTQRGLNTGIMLDIPAVPYGLSVIRYFSLEARHRQLNDSDVYRYINDFDLASKRKKSFKSLSQGWKRRVLLVCLLMLSPEFLVLDEPTNSLDIEGITWLREIIKARTQRGLTTFVSSHNHHELSQVVTRTLILKRQLRYNGDLADLAKDGGDLEKAYFRLTDDSAVQYG